METIMNIFSGIFEFFESIHLFEIFKDLSERPIVLLWFYLGMVNLVALVMMGLDKLNAIQGVRRVSESTLLLLAIVGGSVGAIMGMPLFHHKTRHLIFTIGIPLILLAQVGLVYYGYNEVVSFLGG